MPHTSLHCSSRARPGVQVHDELLADVYNLRLEHAWQQLNTSALDGGTRGEWLITDATAAPPVCAELCCAFGAPGPFGAPAPLEETVCALPPHIPEGTPTAVPTSTPTGAPTGAPSTAPTDAPTAPSMAPTVNVTELETNATATNATNATARLPPCVDGMGSAGLPYCSQWCNHTGKWGCGTGSDPTPHHRRVLRPWSQPAPHGSG